MARLGPAGISALGDGTEILARQSREHVTHVPGEPDWETLLRILHAADTDGMTSMPLTRDALVLLDWLTCPVDWAVSSPIAEAQVDSRGWN